MATILHLYKHSGVDVEMYLNVVLEGNLVEVYFKKGSVFRYVFITQTHNTR